MPDDIRLPASIAELDQLKRKLEELKAVGRLDEIRQAFSDLREEARALADRLLRVREGTEEHRRLQAQLRLNAEATRICKDALGGFHTALEAAKDAAKEFNTKLEETDEALKQMGMRGHPAMSVMRGLFDALKDGGKVVGGASALVLALGNDFTRGMVDPLSSAEDQVKAFGHFAVQLNGVLKNQAEVASMANRGFLAFGGTMGDAAPVARVLADSIASISASIGAGKKEVGEWMGAMMAAAPVAQAFGKDIASAGQATKVFEQQMLLAKAAGMGMQQVQDLVSVQFRQFGERDAAAANRNIAMFVTLARETRQPVKDIADQVRDASTPFAIFGRQLGETANLWRTFAEGMRGLPVAEIGKMVKTVSENIANMRLETQAFVAQMGGMAMGATALGGALRMELEMRQPGGAERNLERVMQSITRMTGGRVLTLEEAAQTPALEMQFQMQRQLAGQMLGVQGTAQQSRLLEVLQGVQQGGVMSVDALKDISGLTEEGRKAQEQSVPLLTRIAASVGRVPEMANALGRIADAPRAMVERAGRAAAAAAPGAAPDPRDIRQAGRYFAEGAQLFTAQLGRSLPALFDTLTARFQALGRGVGSLQSRREREMRREAVAGRQEPLLMAPLPPGAGPPSRLSPLLPPPGGRGREAEAEAVPPLFRPQERRERRMMTLPPAYMRPEAGMPPGLPGGAEPAPPAGWPAPPKAPPSGIPATDEEARVATPLEPAAVKVTVVCEKCLERKIHEAVREERGDRY